ncbi:MAG: hypothetical protein P1V21_18765 [Rhizobiaceae bacterium]|nr:hypothetical protein [Rhizobiaceae bacterium]
MSHDQTSIVRNIFIAIFVFLSISANAHDAAVQTRVGRTIPAQVLGIVVIESPRQASLLQLRGMAGQGKVILRSDDRQDCLTFPVRFVAGDFGGSDISVHSTRQVRLVLQSRRVVEALAKGDDVVSDMYRVSSHDDDARADILIQTGLSEGHGFVLNPGSSILEDVVGVRTTRTDCSEL